MDMSLDDFIKKSNKRRGAQDTRQRSQSTGGNRRNSSGNIRQNRNRQNVSKPLQNSNRFTNKPARRNIVDARLKIIQNNRMKLTDAREKLIKLAKQTDARTKIKGNVGNLRRNINNRRDLGRGKRQNIPGDNRSAPPVLQRSIRNNLAQMRANDLIRCTINRPIINYGEEVSSVYEDEMDLEMPLLSRPTNDLSSIKVVAQNEYLQYGQEYSRVQQEPMHLDYEPSVFNRQLEPPRGLPSSRSGVRMSQEMRARLDTPPPPVISKPSGLFSWQPLAPSSPPAPAPQPQGHRIVVSNLHSSVTHEDIKELFEDIGPLITSRLVRPGTAEVIYKFQRDAKKAVEAYHNRQLDKLPMKCMLVTPRPSTESSGMLRPSVLPSTPKFPSSNKSTVVPDISAIHKALFMNK